MILTILFAHTELGIITDNVASYYIQQEKHLEIVENKNNKKPPTGLLTTTRKTWGLALAFRIGE